MFKRVVDNGTV